MDPLEIGFAVFVALFVFGVLYLGVIGPIKRKKRRAAFAVLADELGLRFQESPALRFLPPMTLFEQGDTRTVDYLMAGTVGEVPVHLFEYSWTNQTSGVEARSSGSILTIFYADTSERGLPRFELGYRNAVVSLLEKWGVGTSVSKGEEVSLPPELSKKYQLVGDSSEEVGRLFSPDVLATIGEDKKRNFEINDSNILIYRNRVLTSVADVRALYDEGCAFLQKVLSKA